MKTTRSKTITVLRALAPYAAMLAVTAWLLTGFSLPVYSLFQSSVSPVATPTPAPPPTNTPKPAPQSTNTPVPPAPTNTPAPAPTEEPTVEPTATTIAQAEDTTRSAVVTQTETLTTTETMTSTEAITPVQPLTATEPESVQPAAVAEQPPVVEQPPAEEPVATGGVVVNEVKLVDTIVKGLAYGWMCIGGGLLLAILAIFPLLQLRGTRLNRDDNS